MPGKKKGGGRRKSNTIKTRRLEDITKDFDASTFEVYGQVKKAVGNRRFDVEVQDLHNPKQIKGTINCSIKGSYRRRITNDQYVLVKLYDFNTEQGQIIDSYSSEEVQSLKTAEMWDYPGDDSKIDTESESDSDSESEPEPDEAVKVKAQAQAQAQYVPYEDDADIDIDAI